MGKEEKGMYQCSQLSRQLCTGFFSCFESYVAVKAIALDVMRNPDDCSLGHTGMLGLRGGRKKVGNKKNGRIGRRDGWKEGRTSDDSTSAVPRLCPETMTTSSARPVIQ